MKVKAQLNRIRIAPRKVRLVADLIRGKKVEEALVLLGNAVKKSSLPLEKLVKSVVANAENNFKLKKSDLYITEILVNEGPTLKRWMPRAYGRASKILKRTSHVTLVVEEKVEEKIDTDKNNKEKNKLKQTNKISAKNEKMLKEKQKKEIEKDEEKALDKLTEGSQKIEEKISEKKEKLSQKEVIKHKEVVNPRNASRETGRTQKIFKKTSKK